MNTNIFVTIHNLNALNQGSDMVIDIDKAGNLILQPYNSKSTTQVWKLIPNLVLGAEAGGFTLVSPAKEQSACNPNVQGEPVFLNDEPVTFGVSVFCWTMFNAKASSIDNAWTIQDFQQGLCMNARNASIQSETLR